MFRILPSVIDAMTTHAQESAPAECCGLLVGGGGEILDAVRTRNVEEGPTRYRIDPLEHIALLKRLRGSGRAIVGAYHSHPRSAAEPSPSDIAEAFYPDFVYVIVSLAAADRPECRGWRIRDGVAEEVRLETV
jgi:proteasome lid subunit RPN8/RPN11